MASQDSRAQIHQLLEDLRTPIPNVPTLLTLLSAPLSALNLLPPQFIPYNTRPLPPHTLSIPKHIPQIQRVLLSHIAPTWDSVLAENHASSLLTQYFVPEAFANPSIAAGEVARAAYATLVSEAPMGRWAMGVLGRLAGEYPVDRMFRAVFAGGGDGVVRGRGWEDCVRDLCMVPAKVANALGGGEGVVGGLENGVYFDRMSVRCEELIWSLSLKSSKDALPSIAYLLSKLVNVGVFPPSPPIARSQPSFFHSTLPTIRSRLHPSSPSPSSSRYAVYWHSVILAIPSSLTLQSILTSLFASLSTVEPPTDAEPARRARVRGEAALLKGVVGDVSPDEGELWEVAVSLVLSRSWDESYARIFACWFSGAAGEGSQVNLKVLQAFLESVLDTWSTPEHIKHSLISRHRYTTSLLLLTASYFPPSSPPILSLASSPNFINGIGIYIAHLDASVRLCGMLAAEVVAHMCGRKLDFGAWDEEGSGRAWAREVRVLLKARDADALVGGEEVEDVEVEVEEVITPAATKAAAAAEPPRATFIPTLNGYDSDDSLTGYLSPPSSRSASPTPSELAEIEKDPTLNVGLHKVPRPVYLAQLGELLRGTGTQGKRGMDDPHEAERIEVALGCAEELIRKKRGYGTELDENAVNLVYALMGLQDNFELPEFSEKRQGALNALVSGSPRKATPALIEEFFKNQYSTDQRFVALNAIAIGARELASLPVPPSKVPPERIAFPSKTLPGPLHQKYIKGNKANANTQLSLMMDEISRHALDSNQKEAEHLPAIARERRLRIQKPQRITELPHPLNPYSSLPQPIPQQHTTNFIDVAAEFFILPLISHFWSFLRDSHTREQRTSHHPGRARYRGAGTGLILHPLVLAQWVRTVGILVHAGRNAVEWGAVVAPGALEVAVTIGGRRMSAFESESEDAEDGDEDGDTEGKEGKEASVLTSALELALVILNASLEIDGGRNLGLEHTTLVLGVGEWAGNVFAGLERGLKPQGGGGLHEAKLQRAAAGVVLKVDELTTRWGRSMLDTR
ncbi:telomeric DNA binding protein [Crassisporium funariophilum]|nr:telomeric DNA binding protein [Crassisporium funariophilum]